MKDRQGRGAASEVTLWAVDYGVLSLTAYPTPDVLRSVYVEKALQVMNADSRQRIVSRRVLTPKGDTDGGGGGADAGAGTLRKDFRVLAFWLGSVDDRRERPRRRRRQAAGVADDVSHHGGRGRPSVAVRIGRQRGPRQQAADAEADVPAVPGGRRQGARSARSSRVSCRRPARAVVTIKSLDPDVLQLRRRRGADAADRAPAVRSRRGSTRPAESIGRARVQMTVKVGERDRRVRGRRSRSKCWRRRKPSRRTARPATRRDRDARR